ncbi:MAG: hypothetical protein HOV68_30205, partial [Streptomycetaceae bacterium]|nr:hypothetical protein [Streptomycetaceae bacterium]
SSPCQYVRGQLWWYGGSQTGILVNNWSSWLRTSPSGSDAVYATHETSTYDEQTHWVGYHT